MKTSILTILLLIVLSCLSCANTTDVSITKSKSFSELDPEVQSLNGIEGCKVVINNLSEAAEQIELSDDTLMKDVELCLSRGGIKKISDEQAKMISYEPCLEVLIKVVISNDLVVYNISLRFKQRVSLLRKSELLNNSYYGTTWSTDGIGLAELNNNPRVFIRVKLQAYMDKFIDAFQKANSQTLEETLIDDKNG